MSKLVYESDFYNVYDELNSLYESTAGELSLADCLEEGFNLEALHEGIGDKLKGLVSKISGAIKDKLSKKEKVDEVPDDENKSGAYDVVYKFPEIPSSKFTEYRYEHEYWNAVKKLIDLFLAGEIASADELEAKAEKLKEAAKKKFPEAAEDIDHLTSAKVIRQTAEEQKESNAQALENAGAKVDDVENGTETNGADNSSETVSQDDAEEKPEEKAEQGADDKNAKRQASRQNNSKILKALKAAGIPVDSLMVKNGAGKMKASAKLVNLRKALFGESLEEDADCDELEDDLDI